jgi:uncharacterized membrane protein
MFIAMIPFSTAFLSEYIIFKLKIGVYWFNILIPGLIAYAHWQYACKNNFVSLDAPEYEMVDKAMRNRIITAQIFMQWLLFCALSVHISALG